PAAESDGKFHKLEVKVSRRGVRLVYQRGYAAPVISATPLEWLDAELLSAIGTSLASGAIGLDGRVKRGADGTIDIAIDIQAKDLQFAHSAERTAADLDVVVVE